MIESASPINQHFHHRIDGIINRVMDGAVHVVSAKSGPLPRVSRQKHGFAVAFLAAVGSRLVLCGAFPLFRTWKAGEWLAVHSTCRCQRELFSMEAVI